MAEISEASDADIQQLESVSSLSISQDDDTFEDETIAERLWGLTEMFPESLRDLTSKTTNLSVTGVKKVYKFSRSTLWVLGTSFVILAMPVLFEVERVQSEEAALMQQRQVFAPWVHFRLNISHIMFDIAWPW